MASGEVKVKIAKSQLRNFGSMKIIENLTRGHQEFSESLRADLEGQIEDVETKVDDLPIVPDFELKVENFTRVEPSNVKIKFNFENKSGAARIENLYEIEIIQSVTPVETENLETRQIEKIVIPEPEPGDPIVVFLNGKAGPSELIILDQYMELRNYYEDINEAKRSVAELAGFLLASALDIPPPFSNWVSNWIAKRAFPAKGMVTGILKSNFDNVTSLPIVKTATGLEKPFSVTLSTKVREENFAIGGENIQIKNIPISENLKIRRDDVVLGSIENLEIHLENENDTDKDGIPDWYEEQEMAQWGADPNHRDIFVEMDRMEDSDWPVSSVKQELIETFEDSPIENPDGTTGVRLHLIDNDVLPQVDEFDSSMLTEYIENYKDHGKGFYYSLLLGDSVGYGATAVVGAQGFYFYPSAGLSKNYSRISSIFMHELGHCLGLLSSTFEGIDSHKYSFSQYRSVMNYSSPADFCNYSSGPQFDDWEYLENEGFFLPAFRENVGIENIQVVR